MSIISSYHASAARGNRVAFRRPTQGATSDPFRRGPRSSAACRPKARTTLGGLRCYLHNFSMPFNLQLDLPALLFRGKAPFLFLDGYIYVDGYIMDPKCLCVSSTSASTSCTGDRAWLISPSGTYYPVPSTEETVKLESGERQQTQPPGFL